MFREVIPIAYQYVALSQTNEVVKGRLDAASEAKAVEALEKTGYQVVTLKQVTQSIFLEKIQQKFSARIKSTEMVLFYQQLALLMETGMNIVSAMEILGEQATNRALKKVLSKVISDVRGGSQVSEAMSQHPGAFPPIHCHSLKVGERTGGLDAMLKQVAEHMERDLKSAKGVKNAMTYPIIALVVAMVVVVIMVTFVFPSFKTLFTSLGADLPPLTKAIITVSDLLLAYGGYILLVIVLGAAVIMFYFRTQSGRYKWDQLSIDLPLVGRINHLNSLASLSRNISLLFHAGLPLTEILPIVIGSTGNRVIVKALQTVRQDMLSGEGLSLPMSRNKLFLPLMVQMVKVGEETGNLDNTLLSVAKAYEVDAEDKTRAFIGLLQPVMMIVIGVVVGVMALSMVSAMSSLYEKVG